MRKRERGFTHKSLLKDVEPHEFVRWIKRLPKSHQGIIARVIWWDFFAEREVPKRTNLFDEWLTYDARKEDPPKEELAESLEKMGYPRDISLKRFEPRYYKVYYEPNQTSTQK